MCFQEFVRRAPADFEPGARHTYKYFATGKGCTLGVLFEDSTSVYFEWLTEAERRVPYDDELRYKAWPKREFARLVRRGVWEVTDTCDVPEAASAP
jgi:hypothetical protein